MSETVQELVLKKRGKPLIIGKHLDKQVRECNKTVAITAGTGIAMNHHPNLLIEDYCVTLTKD